MQQYLMCGVLAAVCSSTLPLRGHIGVIQLCRRLQLPQYIFFFLKNLISQMPLCGSNTAFKIKARALSSAERATTQIL